VRAWGAAVLRPYEIRVGIIGVGEVESKPRDLGCDCGYRAGARAI